MLYLQYLCDYCAAVAGDRGDPAAHPPLQEAHTQQVKHKQPPSSLHAQVHTDGQGQGWFNRRLRPKAHILDDPLGNPYDGLKVLLGPPYWP